MKSGSEILVQQVNCNFASDFIGASISEHLTVPKFQSSNYQSYGIVRQHYSL